VSRYRIVLALAALSLLAAAVPAAADHIPGRPCDNCASHEYWPTIHGRIVKANNGQSQTFQGTSRSDELLGHHGSDKLFGHGRSDVLWGDWEGGADQPTNQRDRIYGGPGDDFIYGSHGRNVIFGGPGNDAISVHYGRGFVDCGPGRDIYHVAKSRRKSYRFRNCEKVDYRPEAARGGHGLKPLP
jgi:Ca2+-binding RTX toxin-like protein